MRTVAILCVVFALAGCATAQYTGPEKTGAVVNSKVIDRPRSQVWDAAVPELAKSFFVVNNLDKASGLINVSYSGAPDRFLDCGQITVNDPVRGQRTFPGSQSRVEYQIQAGLFPITVKRYLDLEGRANVVFEEVGADKTRVSVNARYIVKRRITAIQPNGASRDNDDQVAFNSGATGNLTSTANTVTCAASGELEAEILRAIR